VQLWYVSYGSNLEAARFGCYLRGGRTPGSRVVAPGCRDPQRPEADQPVELPWALWFGGRSRTWHGGPAFLDTEVAGRTVARAWLVTVEQLADVIAQENHLAPGTIALDDDVLTGGGVVLPDASYGRLILLPPVEGVPAVTFTYVVRPVGRLPCSPYLDVLRRGLGELGLSTEEATTYLATQPQLAASTTWAGAPRIA
jgi:hypothetical protein